MDETLKPLTHARAVEDEQFVIDTPSARERHGIPPGQWRTPIDRAATPAQRARYEIGGGGIGASGRRASTR